MSGLDLERIERKHKEQLHDILRSIEVAPFVPDKNTTAAYSRNIGGYEPLQREQTSQLEALFGEEEEAARNLYDHFQARWFDANVPLQPPKEDLVGLEAAKRSPEITDVVYKGLFKAHIGHLSRNVDSLAYNNIPLSKPPQNLCGVEIPRRAREVMDQFFRRFGCPNMAEAHLLSGALGIIDGIGDTFWQHKRTVNAEAAKWLVVLRRKLGTRLAQLQGT